MLNTKLRAGCYSSGQLVKLTGVPYENIRYFERIGLIPPPEREANGRRVFSNIHLRKLVFIRRARELGFPQDEVRELIALSDGSPGHCAEVKVLADAHLQAVRKRLEALRKMENLLFKVSSTCGKGQAAACPVIDVLFEGDG